MPILCRNRPLVRGDGLQNFMEMFDVMWREFMEMFDVMWRERDSFRSGVNEPSQNYFGCSPRGITLIHFLMDTGS